LNRGEAWSYSDYDMLRGILGFEKPIILLFTLTANCIYPQGLRRFALANCGRSPLRKPPDICCWVLADYFIFLQMQNPVCSRRITICFLVTGAALMIWENYGAQRSNFNCLSLYFLFCKQLFSNRKNHMESLFYVCS
jgi:hypothetical protein